MPLRSLDRIKRIVVRKARYTALGRRSVFDVTVSPSGVTITTKSGKSYTVSESLVKEVEARHFRANPSDRTRTSHYELSDWPDCPNTVVAP